MADSTTENTQADEQKQSAMPVQMEMPVAITYQMVIRNSHANEETSENAQTSSAATSEGSENGQSETADSEKQEDSYFLVDPVSGVQLTRGINGVPSKLTFKVPKDDVLDFKEGNVVQFSVNNTPIFQGYVFSKERDKENTISVVAYDQMRYLKNKDCYVYPDAADGAWTATDLIRNICKDYGLRTGELANTQYVVARGSQPRIEDNKTLIDMINYALDMTLINSKNHDLYHLYDDAGKITLTHMNQMQLDIYVDNETMQNYSYKTSIDNDTYDVVKVIREAPGEKGKKLVQTGLIVDEDHIKEWGKLQYLMRPDDKNVNAMDRAKRIMTLKNRKTREIKLRGLIGDVRVRGGSLIFLNFDFGDIKLQNYMMVRAVTHTFEESFHSMDIDLEYVDKPAEYKVVMDNDAAVLKQIQAAKEAQKGARRGGYSSANFSNSEAGILAKGKSLGFTDNQMAGIMGNIKAEDDNYDPARCEDGEHTGLFQLSKERWKGYTDWCDANGNDYYNGGNQLEYVTTVENGDLRGQIPDDPQGAATWFNHNIEISGDYSRGYRESQALEYASRISSGSLVAETPQIITSYNPSNGAYGANSNLIDAGFSACDGSVSPYGGQGCAERTCYFGSYWNADLCDEYNKGTADCDTLMSNLEAKGYNVTAYTGTGSIKKACK